MRHPEGQRPLQRVLRAHKCLEKVLHSGITTYILCQWISQINRVNRTICIELIVHMSLELTAVHDVLTLGACHAQLALGICTEGGVTSTMSRYGGAILLLAFDDSYHVSCDGTGDIAARRRPKTINCPRPKQRPLATP